MILVRAHQHLHLHGGDNEGLPFQPVWHTLCNSLSLSLSPSPSLVLSSLFLVCIDDALSIISTTQYTCWKWWQMYAMCTHSFITVYESVSPYLKEYILYAFVVFIIIPRVHSSLCILLHVGVACTCHTDHIKGYQSPHTNRARYIFS